jgi:hypothetical protein
MPRKKTNISKGAPSSDSPQKGDPRPKVDDDTVIARNKVDESDATARERVQEDNPGKKVVDETDVGMEENRNAPGKLPDPPVKISSGDDNPGEKPQPDSEDNRKAADERISKRVDATTAPGPRPPMTVKGEDDVDIPIADNLAVAQSSPDAVKVEEETMKRTAAPTFSIDPALFSPKFRSGWETGVTNFITTIEHETYQFIKLGSVGPIASMVEREDSFNSLILDVIRRFEGIAHDVPRTTSYVEGFKHTDWKSMGLDLLSLYNSLPDAEDQTKVVKILKSLSDVKKADQMRGALCAMLPIEREMYLKFQAIEQELEIPYTELRKYVLSKKNTKEAMQPPFEDFRLDYASAAAPPDPTLVHKFMSINPMLVMHWAPKLRAWVSNNMTLPMLPDTITVDDILLRMGFKVGTIDGVKKFMGNMTTTAARDLTVNLLSKRLWGKYFEFTVDVDIDNYSFNTLLSATMWRLFPKHFIAKEWRVSMNNWVWFHYIRNFYLSDRERETAVWDRDKARYGEVDYLRIGLTTFGKIPSQVRAFWDPDNGWGDSGAYEPYSVDPEAMKWERTPNSILFVPMAGRRLESPNVTLQSMARLNEFTTHYNSKRRPALGGNTLHGETYGKILTFISGKVKSHSLMMYMMDQLMRSMGPGMPIYPYDRKEADDVLDGVQRDSIDIMAPLALITLADIKDVDGPPLTQTFKAVESGMTLNAQLEMLIEFHSYFFHNYNTKLRTNSQIVDAFKALLPHPIEVPFSFIFDKWKEAPLKSDIKFPAVSNTRGIWLKKLRAATDFIVKNRELYGFEKYVYLVPPYTSERADNGSRVIGREWVPPQIANVVKISRTDMIDLVTTGKFASIYDDAMTTGKILRIEVWHKFAPEKVSSRPEVPVASLLNTQLGLKHGYEVGEVKWQYTLDDEKYLEDRRNTPTVMPPQLVIPRPTNMFRTLTPTALFGLASTIDARKDIWTYHDFSDFTAVTRETATAKSVTPFE